MDAFFLAMFCICFNFHRFFSASASCFHGGWRWIQNGLPERQLGNATHSFWIQLLRWSRDGKQAHRANPSSWTRQVFRSNVDRVSEGCYLCHQLISRCVTLEISSFMRCSTCMRLLIKELLWQWTKKKQIFLWRLKSSWRFFLSSCTVLPSFPLHFLYHCVSSDPTSLGAAFITIFPFS